MELEVRTDCRPLMFILRQADTTNGCRQRRASALSVFNATFAHVPAEKNALADLLSRLDFHSPVVSAPAPIRTHLAQLEGDAEKDAFTLAALAVLAGLGPYSGALDREMVDLAKTLSDCLSVHEGLLFYSKPNLLSRLWVIPQVSVPLTIDMHHGDWITGHWSFEITLRRLQAPCGGQQWRRMFGARSIIVMRDNG